MNFAVQWVKRIIFGLIGLILLIVILTLVFGWLILLVPVVVLLIAIGILVKFFRNAKKVNGKAEKSPKKKEYIDVEYKVEK
jgi:uncharacterized membrane protein